MEVEEDLVTLTIRTMKKEVTQDPVYNALISKIQQKEQVDLVLRLQLFPLLYITIILNPFGLSYIATTYATMKNRLPL